MIVNKSMFPVQTGFSAITSMSQRLSTLQVQMGTGEKASSLAELGSGRSLSLSVRSRQASIEGYTNTVGTVQLRLSVLDSVISRMDKIESETRTSATPANYGTGDVNLGTTPKLSRARLDEVVTLLNSDVNGRYLFAGSDTEQKPVATIDKLLDGDGTKAGFRTVAAERKAADLGADGKGRLETFISHAEVTLAEDGLHPFGMKLSTVSTNSDAVSLTAPAGTPAALSVEFTAQPIEGESVTMGFTLPDGSTGSISLKAVTGTAGKGEFSIGATEEDTAAAFAGALDTSIRAFTSTTLDAASAFAAADMFFPGPGETAMRVAGPPYNNSTALVAATPADTVQWYGGTTSSDPRSSVTARVEDGTVVSYGVEANEEGLSELVRTLAVMSIANFPSADETSHARFDAMANRQMVRIGENHNSEDSSLEMIGAQLGMAQATTAQSAERHRVYGAQMSNLLANVEQVSKEDVAMEMLALQTRLQASYQITASLSQLSLVNYIK